MSATIDPMHGCRPARYGRRLELVALGPGHVNSRQRKPTRELLPDRVRRPTFRAGPLSTLH